MMKRKCVFGAWMVFLACINLMGCGLGKEMTQTEVSTQEESEASQAAELNAYIVEMAAGLVEEGTFEEGDIYVDSILYGNFSQSESPELLALCKFKNNVHAAGLDRTLAIVFRQDSMEVVAYKEFGHDEVVLRPLSTEAESRILFIGRTTYQGITTQYIRLYSIVFNEWIESPFEGVELQEDDLCYITDDNKLLVVPWENGEYPTEMIFLWEEQTVYEWDEHEVRFVCINKENEELTSNNSQEIMEQLMTADLSMAKPFGGAIDAVDWSLFENVMEPEEYKALQEYLPVLTGEVEFVWQTEEIADSEREPKAVTMDEFRYILNNEIFDYEPDEIVVHSVAVCDLEQDGTWELILELHNIGGRYLILHKEDNTFYGMDRGIRSFLQLQTNGTFISSGGASYNYFHRLEFCEDTFEDVLLGNLCWDEEKEEMVFYIGEKRVDFDTFYEWENNILSGNVVYYEVKNK